MGKLLQKLQLGCFYLIILTFPLNLFYKLSSESSGILNDYLLVKFYLVDVFLWGLIGAWAFEVIVDKKQKLLIKLKLIFQNKYNLLFLTTILVLTIRQIFTPFPFVAVWQLQSWILLGLLIYWIKIHYASIKFSTIYWLVLLVITTQSLLGLYQFTYQKTLFPYHILGETQIQTHVQIPKQDFFALDQLRILPFELGLRVLPHGSTPHPNVLAGMLASGLLLTWFMPDKNRFALRVVSSVFPLTVLFLTFSLSAWIMLVFGTFILKSRHVISRYGNFFNILSLSLIVLIPVCLHLLTLQTSNHSIVQRAKLNLQAVTILRQNLLFGTGLQQFTAELNQQFPTEQFVQPVHHIPLLLLTEVGAFGTFSLVFAFFLLLKKYRKHSLSQISNFQFLISKLRPTYALHLTPFIFRTLLPTAYCLLPLLTLDHYLYTHHQGQILLVLFVILMINPSKSHA